MMRGWLLPPIPYWPPFMTPSVVKTLPAVANQGRFGLKTFLAARCHTLPGCAHRLQNSGPPGKRLLLILLS
jgi:hypothetical protein